MSLYIETNLSFLAISINVLLIQYFTMFSFIEIQHVFTQVCSFNHTNSKSNNDPSMAPCGPLVINERDEEILTNLRM